MRIIHNSWDNAINIHVNADIGAEIMNILLAPIIWFMYPPARHPIMFPIKNKLVIQEPWYKSIVNESDSLNVWLWFWPDMFIIFGIATLVNATHPPTIDEQKETANAHKNWGKLLYSLSLAILIKVQMNMC